MPERACREVRAESLDSRKIARGGSLGLVCRGSPESRGGSLEHTRGSLEHTRALRTQCAGPDSALRRSCRDASLASHVPRAMRENTANMLQTRLGTDRLTRIRSGCEAAAEVSGFPNAMSSGPTMEWRRRDVAVGRIGAHCRRPDRAIVAAGSRCSRAQRDDGSVVGAARDRVRAAGDPVQTISGTSQIIGVRVAAGISRRPWPQTCIGKCAGVGAVAGALVTGVVRMHAPEFPNAMSAKPTADARQRDAETTSLALAKAGARAAAESSAPRRMRASATPSRRLRRASGSERGNRRLRKVVERIAATVRTKAGAATGAAGAGAAATCQGRRPARAWLRDDAVERRRSRAMTASPYGTEALCGRSRDLREHGGRILRIETGRFVMDHGCRVPMRIGKAMTCSRRKSWTAQPSTGTMADARQRDAESRCAARATASAATGGCRRWPRESRPRCGGRRARRPAQPEHAPP